MASAYWADSVLLASQHRLTGKMTEAELRRKATPVLGALLKNRNPLIPGIAQIQNSDTRTNSTYLLNKVSHSITNARAHAHTGSKGTSTAVNLAWVTYAADFKISLKNADYNVFTWQEMFDNEVYGSFIDLHDDMETDALAWLSTYKSLVIIPNSGASSNVLTWDTSNYIAGVAAADQDYFIQQVKLFMFENKYKGELDLICDPGLYAKLEKSMNQGTANAENTGFQFSNVNIYPTSDAAATAVDGYSGLGYIVPTGMIGVVDWIPKLNREGKETKAYSYSSMPDLFGTGMPFAVHMYETGADNASYGGETQDVDQEFEFSVDIAKVYAPTSTSNEYPIFKVGLLAT